MDTTLRTIQDYRLHKLNKQFNNLFSINEMNLIMDKKECINRFNQLTVLSADGINVLNKYETTKNRIKDYIIHPFNQYETLYTISIYKNSMLYISQIFRSQNCNYENHCKIYNKHKHQYLSLKDGNVVEVVINTSLVLLTVLEQCVINTCDTTLIDYLKLLD